MRTRAALAALVFFAMAAVQLPAQNGPSPPSKKSVNKNSPVNKLLGGDAAKPNGPITTEIYADEAFFDSNKSLGIFSGHVKVTDPRFNLQSDKLTVFIGKGENQGLERAVAEGNVAVVRDRPDPDGGLPTRAVGRSEKATYVAATGDVELTGTPRVQQGLNTHIATSPDTVMVINQSGQLATHGPSRTDIRQEAKDGEEGKSDAAKSETKSDETKDKAKKPKSKLLNNHG